MTHHQEHKMAKYLRADNDVIDSLKEQAGITYDYELADAIGMSKAALVLIRRGGFPGAKFQTWVYRNFGEVTGLYYLEP